DTAFPQHRFMLSGKTFDGFGELGGLRGPLDCTRVCCAISEIGRDRITEQKTLLWYEPDLATQLVNRDVPDRNSVDQNLAFLRIMKTRDEIHQRCLSAARCSNYAE